MNENYPFKHWGLTLLIAPIPLILNDLLSFFFNWDILHVFNGHTHPLFYIITIFFSTFLSVPSFLVGLLLFYVLKRTNIAPIYAKFILIVIGLVGVTITFQFILIIIRGLAENLMYIYGVASFLAGSVLKIEEEKIVTKQE
ncbi:MAG: hypothetical protein MUC49_13105 [Raineya sp.]|nr:hypothetical protein [Raineya sp.]